MKQFIRLGFFTIILLGAIGSVQGQLRQVRLGDNLGDHMASKDLNMNKKQILNAEGIAIGSATITNLNVAFQIDGTNKAILMPRITALTAIATPVNGMLVYNSTDNKFYVRENGVWVTFATITDLNDKTSNIKIDNITIIKDNTGALAANVNSAIWNANKLQGNPVSATAPLNGQVLSWNGTAWVPSTATSVTAQTVTAAAQPAITSVGTLTGLTVTNPIVGSVTGNAAKATALATPRTINGVAFDGTANISIGTAGVPFTPAGSIAATNAQAALVELDGDIALKAPLLSPNLTGTPTAPTAIPGTNSTQLATTAFVAAAAGLADADATTKGKIQLAGDLTGTAASPAIAASAVTVDKIGALAVTDAKLAANAVTEAKINNGAVTVDKIGALAVTDAKLAANAVTEAKINNGAVTVDKIGALAVTDAKLAANAVTVTKIASGGNDKILSTNGAGVVNWMDKSSLAAVTPDADATTNGKIRLAGDLTGTAASPVIAASAVTVDKIGALCELRTAKTCSQCSNRQQRSTMVQ